MKGLQASSVVILSTYWYFQELSDATEFTIARNTQGPTLVRCRAQHVVRDHPDSCPPSQVGHAVVCLTGGPLTRRSVLGERAGEMGRTLFMEGVGTTFRHRHLLVSTAQASLGRPVRNAHAKILANASKFAKVVNSWPTKIVSAW